MKRIFAVTGDYYHPQSYINEALETALEPLTSSGAVVLEQIGEDELAAKLAEKPDAVVLFKENRVNPQEELVREWMTPETEAAIAAYVEAGGAWLGWHSGLASYAEQGAYVGMLRGHFLHHPSEHQVVSYGAEPSKQAEFAFPDEHYFVSVKEGETEVFLRSHSVDGDSIAAWRHAYGQGRVLCLTPAHLPEGLRNSGFQHRLLDAVRWLLRQE